MSQKQVSLRYILTATLLGNTLEWYDIATFGFLAPVLTRLYFPESDPITSLMYTMMGLVFGSILRPLGGLILGFIGDRYGRRLVLLITIALVSIPTLIIGLLPTYLQIGLTATVLLCIMRLIQGIAAGGEFPGAVTFLVESSPPHKRGFVGSFAYFGIALGMLCGIFDLTLVSATLSEENFYAWGWRSIFISGALAGGIAFLLRRKLHETHPFERIRHSHEILKDPLKTLFLKYKTGIAQLIGIELLETLGFNLIITFSTVYLTNILEVPISKAIVWNGIFLAVLLVAIPFAGWLASHIGPRKMAVYAAFAYLIFSMPLYWLIQYESWRILTPIGFGLLVASYMAPMPAIYCELFPTKVRFSGVALGLNLTVGIIGGLAPLFVLGFFRLTGFKMAPPLFLMIGALISLATLRTIRHPYLSEGDIEERKRSRF